MRKTCNEQTCDEWSPTTQKCSGKCSAVTPVKSDIKKLAEALLVAHKNIAAGTGFIEAGEVVCVCSECKLARNVLEG